MNGEEKTITIDNVKYRLVPIVEPEPKAEQSEEIPAPTTPPPPPPTKEPAEEKQTEEKPATEPPEQQPKTRRLQKLSETIDENTQQHKYVYLRPRVLKAKNGSEPIIKYSQVVRTYTPKAQNETLAHKRKELTDRIVKEMMNDTIFNELTPAEIYDEYCQRMEANQSKPYVFKSFIQWLL